MGEQRRRQALRSAAVEPPPPAGNRKPWVRAVLAFWIAAGITLIVLLTTGKLNPILVGITLGTMVLGIWLKIRHQRQLPDAAARRSGND